MHIIIIAKISAMYAQPTTILCQKFSKTKKMVKHDHNCGDNRKFFWPFGGDDVTILDLEGIQIMKLILRNLKVCKGLEAFVQHLKAGL